MDYTNISGMDYNSATQFIGQYIISLNQTRKQLEAKYTEYLRWKERAVLAAEKDRPDLQARAVSKAEDLKYELETLRAEERQLEFEIAEMKRQLANLKNSVIPTVDAAALLEQLESVVGKKDELAETFKKEEADIALEELKKKMQNEEENGSS
jgi:phage shock protein A